ncbi:MAG: M3 family oligoendopeptidase [bacterium]
MATLERHSTLYFRDFQERLTKEKVEEWLGDVLAQIPQNKNTADWEKTVLYWNEIKAHLETHGEKISLAFNRNTLDPQAEAEEKRLHEEIEPPYKALSAQIREQVLKSPERAALEKKFGAQYFLQLQIQQDSFAPKNIEMETKINDILSDYTKLTGTAEYEVQGKVYPLSHQRKFACSPNANIRRESMTNYSGWFLKNRDRLEDIYDRCVALRTQMGKELGHADYIPLAYQKMRRTDYGPKEVAEFRKQIKEVVVPLTTQIRKRQAKSLGYDSLPIWDTEFFPEWQVKEIKVDIPDQVATGHKVFQSLSPRLGEHFKKMMEWDLIDVPARPGKAPGAFCTDFADYRVPFIFLNSVGEVSDVTTLLHESGHAFQAWESRPIELMELRWPTLEACEVHSMGMEFLAHPYYEDFFSAEDAARFRKYHVAESLILLPYIAMVDEFQHRVYSGEAVGAEGRAKAWEELEKEYLPSLDYQHLAPWRKIRWLRQLHIFKHPFYYIDYAIALTGALQLWIQSVKDKKAAMENYLNLCRLGGTLPLKQFFKAGNLKLPFETGTLQHIMDEALRIEPLLS